MDDGKVYSLNCKLQGTYRTQEEVQRAIDLILSEPEKYLKVFPWVPTSGEYPFIHYVNLNQIEQGES